VHQSRSFRACGTGAARGPHAWRVRNRAVEQDENSARAVIHVIDSGPEIAPELLATLFDRFRRGSDSPGLGIGLHLARRIATIHGGVLGAESRLSTGTKFRPTLPLPRASE
jgi:signal transduction histidine kinase